MAKVKEMTAREPQLPQLSDSFTTAQAHVVDNNYEVVVCGEVKKGKSSFINALLGQRLLPVNSDVTTAHVQMHRKSRFVWYLLTAPIKRSLRKSLRPILTLQCVANLICRYIFVGREATNCNMSFQKIFAVSSALTKI